jgi:5-methylcytosine-specific restriction endonuclease McrA
VTIAAEYLVVGCLCLAGLWPFRKRRNSSSDWWRWYNGYLRSPEWKLKRQAVVNRAGGRCERCGNFGRLDVHHLPGSYARIPNELPWDLAALCFECHKAQHPGKRF